MEQPDIIIHQPVRLKIMSALKPLPPREQIEFVRLRKLIAASEGNLSVHLQTLEQAGYISIEKDFADNRPRTRIKLSAQGRRAYENYIGFFRELISE
jgi:DNA-binding MarR family transcriptional regulator